MSKWLTRLLFDWVFVLLYKLFRALLILVDFLESIFDVFAGITKVSYNGQKDYLINVFFGQNIIAVIFWGMTAISLVLCFAFTIVAVTRKILDIGGGVRQSLGQILNGALRSCVSFLFVSVICIASVNLANICLIQVNYLMKNASTLLYDGDNEKKFTGEENAAMTRIMNTIANYSINSSTENRYNINVCFNSIREDLLFLQQQQFFSYEYPMIDGHHSWQSAIALIAGAGDIGQDLELETVDSSITEAISTVMNEIKYNPKFRPLETAVRPDQGEVSVSNTIFLVSSLEAANSSVYRNNPSFDDALRRSYLNGTNSYRDLNRVRKDFDIWEMRYDVGYITCVVFMVIMTQCIFLFILRLFDLLLLYLAAPAFVSTIPLDDGTRFQTWRQAFTIKIVSGFGSVMAMRLYLVMIQVIMDGKLRFFESNATNYLCQLLFILGGAFAVLKASPLLTQIVAGNGGAAANSEALGAAMGGILGGKLVQAAGMGVKGAKRGLKAGAEAAQLPGKAFRSIQRRRARHKSAAEAKAMSNEALGIGSSLKVSSKKEKEGNGAKLSSPQSRGGGGAKTGGATGKQPLEKGSAAKASEAGNKFSAGTGNRSTGKAGNGGSKVQGGAKAVGTGQGNNRAGQNGKSSPAGGKNGGSDNTAKGTQGSGKNTGSGSQGNGGRTQTGNVKPKAAVQTGKGAAGNVAAAARRRQGGSRARTNQAPRISGKQPIRRNNNNGRRTGSRPRGK